MEVDAKLKAKLIPLKRLSRYGVISPPQTRALLLQVKKSLKQENEMLCVEIFDSK